MKGFSMRGGGAGTEVPGVKSWIGPVGFAGLVWPGAAVQGAGALHCPPPRPGWGKEREEGKMGWGALGQPSSLTCLAL